MSEGASAGGPANVIGPAPVAQPVAQPRRGQDAVRDLLAAAKAGEAGEAPPSQQSAGQVEPGTEGVQTIDQQGSGQPEGIAAPDEGGKLSLSQLAERAGISEEELYQLNIPLKDERGEVSLGTLKEGYTENERLKDQRQKLDSERTDWENEQIRVRQELQQLVSLLPELPPELLQQAQRAHTAAVDQNTAALLEIKPEWADTHAFQRAQNDILNVVKDYGFDRTDLDAVLDYRLTKMLHDFAMLKKQVAEAGTLMKEVRSKGTSQQGAARNPTVKDPALQAALAKAKTGDSVDKQNAVAALLRDANK